MKRRYAAGAASLIGGLALSAVVLAKADWSTLALAEQQQTPPIAPDIPQTFVAPTATYDYVKRDVMIPMRDGVRLHTVIVVPKGARNAPMLLTRTPYNASARAERNRSPHMLSELSLFDEVFASARAERNRSPHMLSELSLFDEVFAADGY